MHFAHFLPCNIISKLFSPGAVKVFVWYLYCICGVFVLYLCLIFFLPMLLPLTKHCSLLTYWSCKSALNALQCQVKLELVLIMSTLAFPWFLQLHSCTMYSGTLHVAYLWRYNFSSCIAGCGGYQLWETPALWLIDWLRCGSIAGLATKGFGLDRTLQHAQKFECDGCTSLQLRVVTKLGASSPAIHGGALILTLKPLHLCFYLYFCLYL